MLRLGSDSNTGYPRHRRPIDQANPLNVLRLRLLEKAAETSANDDDVNVVGQRLTFK